MAATLNGPQSARGYPVTSENMDISNSEDIDMGARSGRVEKNKNGNEEIYPILTLRAKKRRRQTMPPAQSGSVQV